MPLDASLQWVMRFVDALENVFVHTCEHIVRMNLYVIDDVLLLLVKIEMLCSASHAC